MRISNFMSAMALGILLASPAISDTTFSDQEFTAITNGMDQMIDALAEVETYAPGAVIVVATADGRRWFRTHGVSNLETGTAITADTELYIASQTKQYMGLLAAHLHERGILDLDTTLDDYWPGLSLPEGRNADEISLRDLITHQIAIEAEAITGTEAYIRDLSTDEYRAFLESYAVTRDEGFMYDNLGYNIYGAVLELHTGRNWRDWLDEVIFEPNGMTGTSGRVSDFPAYNVAWGHQLDTGIAPFWPTQGRWHPIPAQDRWHDAICWRAYDHRE